MSDRVLLDLIADLPLLDEAATIFAAKPWELQSRATLVHESVDTTEPRDGLDYFLEVDIAKDVISGMNLDPRQQCDRLIEYAINDC